MAVFYQTWGKGDDVENLTSEIRGCEICADLPLGPRPIFKIEKQAKILIAGQAPGRITHAKGPASHWGLRGLLIVSIAA